MNTKNTNKNSVWWFTSSESPDQDFFKYGNSKPSKRWCMFSTELLALKHAYNYYHEFMDFEDEMECNENSTSEDYKVFFNKVGGFGDVIEIKIDVKKLPK